MNINEIEEALALKRMQEEKELKDLEEANKLLDMPLRLRIQDPKCKEQYERMRTDNYNNFKKRKKLDEFEEFWDGYLSGKWKNGREFLDRL